MQPLEKATFPRFLASVLFLTIPFAVACTEDASEDGRDDDFVSDGKSDVGGISEGSPQARGVLRVANELSLGRLIDEVGLSVRAAENVVAVRLGDDENSMTDDVVFTTLAQLDEVPFIGPIAFGKLLRYAEANGYISGSIVRGTLDVPAFLLAYRPNMNAAWTTPRMISDTEFELEVDGPYVLSATCSFDGEIWTYQYAQVADDGELSVFCGNAPLANIVSGSMAQPGKVFLAGGVAGGTEANWAWSLPATNGTHDLIATTADAVALRRNIEVTSNLAIDRPIDMSAEGIPLLSGYPTVGGVGGSEMLSADVRLRSRNVGRSARIYGGGINGIKFATPAALLPTDRQRVTIFGKDGNYSRSATRVIKDELSVTAFSLPPRIEPRWTWNEGTVSVSFDGILEYDGVDLTLSGTAGGAPGIVFVPTPAYLAQGGSLSIDTKMDIPGFRPEWKIDISSRPFDRYVSAYRLPTETTDLIQSDYSDTLGAGQMRVSPPVQRVHPRKLAAEARGLLED